MSKVIGIKENVKEKDGKVYHSFYASLLDYEIKQENGRGYGVTSLFIDENAIKNLHLKDFRDLVGKEIEYYLNKKFRADSPNVVGMIVIKESNLSASGK